ncbi:MAG: hypothetical protein AVDCRST_MAG50-607, partial [uncultured Acidimicrobiales bacterium]
ERVQGVPRGAGCRHPGVVRAAASAALTATLAADPAGGRRLRPLPGGRQPPRARPVRRGHDRRATERAGGHRVVDRGRPEARPAVRVALVDADVAPARHRHAPHHRRDGTAGVGSPGAGAGQRAAPRRCDRAHRPCAGVRCAGGRAELGRRDRGEGDPHRRSRPQRCPCLPLHQRGHRAAGRWTLAGGMVRGRRGGEARVRPHRRLRQRAGPRVARVPQPADHAAGPHHRGHRRRRRHAARLRPRRAGSRLRVPGRVRGCPGAPGPRARPRVPRSAARSHRDGGAPRQRTAAAAGGRCRRAGRPRQPRLAGGLRRGGPGGGGTAGVRMVEPARHRPASGPAPRHRRLRHPRHGFDLLPRPRRGGRRLPGRGAHLVGRAHDHPAVGGRARRHGQPRRQPLRGARRGV